MPAWPHSPAHQFPEAGAYIVTAATYQKAHHFHTPARLEMLTRCLFARAEEYGWELQAWAVFSNHYHFVALSPEDPDNLSKMVSHLHTATAREINRQDETPGRKVWFQYWDTHLTYQRSYLARLSYVHNNPVRHKLVDDATAYPWCSAEWFREHAGRSFYNTIHSIKTDRVTTQDSFQPVLPEN